MTPGAALRDAVAPALDLLPAQLDTKRARVMILAAGLQESDLFARRQLGDGPARGLWQFELGTPASRGGVWGIYLHAGTKEMLRALCVARKLPFSPRSIHAALEFDDILAAGCARLLLFADPRPLPSETDVESAWQCYLRCWRPGLPRPEHWLANHADARAAVLRPPTVAVDEDA